jgi:hypothetical protein
MRTRGTYKVGSHVNLKKKGISKTTWAFIAGFILALIVPFLIDWVLFGTPTPCHTVKTYEDGSSLQACEVRG